MPKVKLPTQLREAAGGESALSVEGTTVGEVLDSLFARHGELRDRLGVEADVIDAGHLPSLARPRETAEWLLKA